MEFLLLGLVFGSFPNQRFANAEITHTLLIYLARYREFASSECMRRVVGLLHRQAVKAKAEGLFFKASLHCFFDLWRRRLLSADNNYFS